MGAIALLGSSWILLAVLLLALAGLIYGFYTASGSDIWPRRYRMRSTGGERRAPGAEGVAETSGRDEGEHPSVSTGTDATAQRSARDRRRRSEHEGLSAG